MERSCSYKTLTLSQSMFPNMNSPEPTHQKPLTSSSSSSPPASSPSIQESPFYSFISNLSPIRSGKAARYTQRFFQSNIASPLPVFATPRMDLERQSSFSQSGKEGEAANSNVYLQSNNQLQPEMVSYFQKEVQSSSPSGCIDEYLADHVEMEGGPSSLPSTLQGDSVHKFSKSGFSCHRHAKSNANDAITGNTRAKMMVSGQISEEPSPSSLCFVENSTHLRSNERFNDSMELTSRKVSDLESDTLLGAFSGGEHRKRVFFQGSDQQERGIRRHLQFGIAMACTNTRNESEDAASLGSPADCMNYEANVPCRSDLRGNSSGQQTDSSPRAVNSLSPFNPSESIRTAQNSGNNASQACISSGIGLHLYSAVKSVFRGTESTASKELAGSIHVPVGGDRKESQAVMTEDSAASKFNTMQPPCYSLQMTLFEQHAPPIEGRFTTSKGKIEESNQTSPQKNRKKGKFSTESDGCKRCNCKRSKCLKLYCECFAAGIYCLNTCSCENCFNKPEYEDTVMDARQAIEARNPLAFAPKVVNHITNSPANTVEERNWTTPASARHKRGCNCKKSKCLKKYCECYQSGVGCSDGCRCESCNNSYGKKAEIMYGRNERWENPSHERLASLETQSNSMKTGSDIQSSPTWEDVIDVSHLTPSSNPRMGTMTFATPLNKSGYSRVSQPQSCHEPAVHSSSGYLQWNHSPTGLTPMFGSEGLHDLSSDIFYNILHGADIPKVLKNTSTPTKGVQITSPNKKRVSPPQIQSAGLRSTSSKGMGSGRKFLQDISSFPSLTPYSNLKGTSYPIDGDGEGSRTNC